MQNKEDFDIIIVGAGASGLMAGYELSNSGNSILIVEARNRIGGRIYTHTPPGFSFPIESGAEFIHGDGPVTLGFLKEENISYHEVEGKMYRVEENEMSKTDFFSNEWETLLDELNKLEKDMTLEAFMHQHFPKENHTDFYDNIKRFVEGYNAADFSKVSALALKQEWGQEEEPTQYRIKGNYKALLDHLVSKIKNNGVTIRLSGEVTEINWKTGDVIVKTKSGSFKSKKCIVTVPVALIHNRTIAFTPDLPTYTEAAGNIGFGGVTKINLEFDSLFWETDTKRKFKDAQFIFTDSEIPTWWTQIPEKTPLLTGWVGGPAAAKLTMTDEEFFEISIKNLSYVFDTTTDFIKSHLKGWRVDQWLKDSFSQGAYSYQVIGSSDAIKILMTPAENTIYFAGEAIYDGPFSSTVEAALESGLRVAKKISSEKK